MEVYKKTKGETCVKSIKILTKEELAKSYDLKGQIYDLISSGNNVFLDMECTAVNVEQAEVVKVIAIKKVKDKIVCFNKTYGTKKPLSKEVVDLIDITNEDIKGLNLYENCKEELYNFIGDSKVFMENFNFAYNVLKFVKPYVYNLVPITSDVNNLSVNKRFSKEIRLFQDNGLFKEETLFSEVLRRINSLYAFCVMGVDKTNCSYYHYINQNTPLHPIRFGFAFNDYLNERTKKDFCYTVSIYAPFFDEVYTTLTEQYGEENVEFLDDKVYFCKSHTFSIKSDGVVIKINFLPQFDLIEGIVPFRQRINKSKYINVLKGQNPECVLGFLMKDKNLTKESRRKLGKNELPF